MELGDVFQRLGVSLGLGLIVGLQRERIGSPLAGFRTFPLVTVFGSISGLLAREYSGWILAAGFIAIATLIVVGNLELRDSTIPTAIKQREQPGLTTEVSMLLMYGLGAFVTFGHLGVAVAIGGTVAVLLHLKEELHSVARRLADPDFKAIMQFVLITLVILPILPNRPYGPYLVLNPFKMWLMVVLIVGISLGGFLVYKFFGERVGTMAGGILGGLISSTATTVSYARRTRNAPETSRMASLVIMVASTIVFARVLILIGATAPGMLSISVGPILAVTGVMAVACLVLWRMAGEQPAEMPKQENPSELKAALIFAALYGLVLLAVAAAKDRFGAQGLYVVAVLSGLTDMDAITLSVSQMAGREQIPGGTAWRLILVAAISNMVFKAGMVASLGNRALLWRIVILFGIAILTALAVIIFWPA